MVTVTKSRDSTPKRPSPPLKQAEKGKAIPSGSAPPVLRFPKVYAPDTPVPYRRATTRATSPTTTLVDKEQPQDGGFEGECCGQVRHPDRHSPAFYFQDSRQNLSGELVPGPCGTPHAK